MLARPTNLSENQAAHYYEQDDYYTLKEASNFEAYWYGRGAKALGLTGAIDPRDFQTLLAGYSPQGRCLHAKPIDSDNHRAGTDYTFNAPKTVSIAALVQGDDRLIAIHDHAVQTALEVKETRYAQARVWDASYKRQVKVCTGNLISAIYRHEVNRNQDPHLHSHDADLNATQVEGRWRAVANEQAVEHQKLLGQIYQNECAYGVRQLGYAIEPRPHGQFELKGYAPEAIAAFSTRRQEIEAFIAGQGESESPRAYQRAALQTRQRKTHLPRSQVHQQWQDKIQQHQLQLPEIPEPAGAIATSEPAVAEQLVQSSIALLVEEQTTFTREQLEHQILETYLGRCPFRELAAAIDHSPDLVPSGSEFTTPEKFQRLQALDTLLGFEPHAEDEVGQTSQIGRDFNSESSRRDDSGLTEAERSSAALRASTIDLERCLTAFDQPDWLSECNASAIICGIRAIGHEHGLERYSTPVANTLDSITNTIAQFRAVVKNLEHAANELARQAEKKQQEAYADRILPIASALFGQHSATGQAVEQPDGTWVVAWGDYTIALAQDQGAIDESLSVSAIDRGELLRSSVWVDGRSQVEVTGLAATDVAAFAQLEGFLPQWQQQRWVTEVAPIAAAGLNLSGELEWVGEHHTVHYQPHEQQLMVQDTGGEPLLIAHWDGDRWLDQGSRLQEADVRHFQDHVWPQVQAIQQQQRQEWVTTQTRIALAYFKQQAQAGRSRQNAAGEGVVEWGDYQMVRGRDDAGEYFALRETDRGELVQQRPKQAAIEMGNGLTPEDGEALDHLGQWLAKQKQKSQSQLQI